jgi:hypothetical protein
MTGLVCLGQCDQQASGGEVGAVPVPRDPVVPAMIPVA